MSINTSNQSKLHSDRQLQLSKSFDYTSNFLSSLSDSDAYKVNPCPTCDSTECNTLFTKNGGDYAYCNNCEHIFLKKSLKADYLIDFYSNYPTSSLDWHKNETNFYTQIYNSGLDLVQKIVPKGSILDIGCSSGFFLTLAKARGFDCFGIEPNKLESKFAINQGLNVLGKTIDDIPLGKKFDTITMWDVLEHIDSPTDFISRITRYLNPGGCIFIQVPTSDSLAAKVMRGKCNMFDGIEHLTLFSKKSLGLCFANCNFSLKQFKNVISDSFAIKNYLSYEEDPYLPCHKTNMFPDNLIAFDLIESMNSGYKIQACYTELK